MPNTRMRLSDRIQSIEESKTVRFTSLVERLRGEGREIINFAVGEPEFETPQEVIASTKNALDAQKTRYGAVQGLPELRHRLAEQFEAYDKDNIIVTNGSKQALFAIFQVICNAFDEVIIPRPCWVSFSQQVRLAGGTPVFVNTKNHQLDCDEIENAITGRTKAILINTPNNPTGAVYPKKDIEAVARLSLAHGLYIISDEAYDLFVYDGLKHASVFAIEDVRDRVVITGSFSKRYSMTGFRVGYLAAPKDFIRAVSKLQSHTTGNVCTFAQYGAIAALSLDKELMARRHSELEKKRNIAYGYASSLFDCRRPQGAFYLFPDVSNHLKPGETSQDLAARLLENAGVAVVPGEAFGMPGHIRISYAVSEDALITGFERITEAL